METKTLIYVLLILCLLGLILTIAADHWHEARRWKIGVLLILVAYVASYGLR